MSPTELGQMGKRVCTESPAFAFPTPPWTGIIVLDSAIIPILTKSHVQTQVVCLPGPLGEVLHVLRESLLTIGNSLRRACLPTMGAASCQSGAMEERTPRTRNDLSIIQCLSFILFTFLSALWIFWSWFSNEKQEASPSGYRKFSCQEVITFLKIIPIFVHLCATSEMTSNPLAYKWNVLFHQAWPWEHL